MKNRIEITIEHKHHKEVVLTNEKGDTFTYDPFVHEGLEDFLSGAKILDIPDVMHSVFTIHSTENDEIIKVVGTKGKAIQEVKEFKDEHAYADFYWEEKVLQ